MENIQSNIIFPEFQVENLLTPLKDKFTIKKPKISINRTMKKIFTIKKDAIPQNSSNINNNQRKIFTEEENKQKNDYNLNLYKNENAPQTKLVYTDEENDEEEIKKLGTPINFDYLKFILQSDPSNIENFIDEQKGKFIENNENIENKFNINNNDIIFDSKFESGNLRMAIKLYSDIENEYDLIMRKDYNSEKNYTWFYFSIKSQKEATIKFNILNFVKRKIQYNEENGIKILTYTEKNSWCRDTFNINFYQNNINIYSKPEDEKKNLNDIDEKDDKDDLELKEDLPDTNFFFTLSFCYHVDKNNINIPIYFALCYPYTYTNLQNYLNDLSNNPKNKNKIKFATFGKTICGNEFDIIYITNFLNKEQEMLNKKSIIFTSRVHPGETCGSYVIESIINNLLNNSQSSKNLLNKYIFKIIPMLNPDGVIHGHYRNNILGKDLNRMYQDPRENITPTCFYLRKLIESNIPFFFCDFHGHSWISNCALYCCSPKKKNKNGAKSIKVLTMSELNCGEYNKYETYCEKVFLKIFGEMAKFYEKSGEKYSISKSLKKSARGVVYINYGVGFTYALESSLMTYIDVDDNNCLKSSNLSLYNQIGTDFINSLVKWDNKNNYYSYLKVITVEEEKKRILEMAKEREKKQRKKSKGNSK